MGPEKEGGYLVAAPVQPPKQNKKKRFLIKARDILTRWVMP